MRLIKKITSTITALVVMLNIGVTVFAEDDTSMGSNEKSAAMIQFFSGENGDFTFTGEDLRVYGAFLSNFYTPYETEATDIAGLSTVACEYLMGGTIPAGCESAVKSLGEAVASNIMENSKPLYFGGSQAQANILDLFPNQSSAATTTFNIESPDGSPMFALTRDREANGLTYGNGVVYGADSAKDQIYGFCNIAFLQSLMYTAGRSDVAEDAFEKLADIYENGSGTLSVTPFGDIVMIDGATIYIIVPACLNPFTFNESGNVLPLANQFSLASLDSTKLEESTLRDAAGYYDINFLLQRGTKDTVKIRCASLTSPSNLTENYLIYSVNQKNLNALLDALDFDKGGVDILERMNIMLCDAALEVGDITTTDSIQGIKLFDFNGKYPDLENGIELKSFFDISNPVTPAGGVPFFSIPDYSEDTKKITQDVLKASHNSFTYNGFYASAFVNQVERESTLEVYDVYSDIKAIAAYATLGNGGVSLYPQIFYTYLTGGMNPNLPECDPLAVSAIIDATSGGLDADSTEMAKTLMQRMIKLTDDGINDEKANLFTNFISSFVLNSHRKMLGITTNNISSVSTSGLLYSGFTGHVTTPLLSDIEYTKGILSNYRTIYAILLSIVILFLAIMFITHMKSIKQCVSLLLVMAICMALPPAAINGTVSLANSATSALYSGRFNYWAMIQHQQDVSDAVTAATTNNTLESLLNANVAKNIAYYSSDGVKLRWMSPRKEDVFDSIFGDSLDDATTANGVISGTNIFKMLFSGYFKGESYSTDSMSTYVYRTYQSVVDEAKELAAKLAESGSASYDVSGIIEAVNSKNGEARNVLEAIEYNPMYSQAVESIKPQFNDDKFRTAALGSSAIERALQSRDVAWGDNADSIGFLLKTSDEATGLDIDDVSVMAYIDYSESPFYYFYNALLNGYTGVTIERGSDGDSADIDTSDATSGNVVSVSDSYFINGYLKSLLSDDLYKVTDTSSPMFGMTKDFLDLEGLFTYVVPYMKSGNDIVTEFVTLRGTDYQKSSASEGTPTSLNTKEEVKAMWNMYCPWVDTLYDTNMLNARIRVMNVPYNVADTFNPAFYHTSDMSKGRYMCFGEADMYVKGVGTNDLTEVERRINKVLEETYIDMRYLANYSAFSDDVLLAASAMIATFNFNNIFSEVHFFSDSHILYPQGYELKTFSYDAFLRLILLNSTGQSIMADSDVYTTVITNTSFITGLFILILDAVAIYVLPAVKLVFLIMVLFLSILMLMTCFLQGVENAPKTVLKVVIFPMLQFLGITLLHALFTSLLMGEGLTDLVGSQTGSIVTNDPTVTILLLLLINVVASVFYIKILVFQVKEGVHWLKGTLESVTGILKSLGDTVANKVTNIASTGDVIASNAPALSSNSNQGLETATAVGAGALGGGALASDIFRRKTSADAGAGMSKEYNKNCDEVVKRANGLSKKKATEAEANTDTEPKEDSKKKNRSERTAKLVSKINNLEVVKNAKASGKNIKEAASAVGGMAKGTVTRGVNRVKTTKAGMIVSEYGTKVKGAVNNARTVAGDIASNVNGKVVKAGTAVAHVTNGEYATRLTSKLAQRAKQANANVQVKVTESNQKTEAILGTVKDKRATINSAGSRVNRATAKVEVAETVAQSEKIAQATYARVRQQLKMNKLAEREAILSVTHASQEEQAEALRRVDLKYKNLIEKSSEKTAAEVSERVAKMLSVSNIEAKKASRKETGKDN